MGRGAQCHRHETYLDSDDSKPLKERWLTPEEVVKKDGQVVRESNGAPVIVGPIEKMSKSKKNVVSPDDIADTYGADAARWFMSYHNVHLYELTLASGETRNLTPDFDRQIGSFALAGERLYLAYDDRGRRVLAELDDGGRMPGDLRTVRQDNPGDCST